MNPLTNQTSTSGQVPSLTADPDTDHTRRVWQNAVMNEPDGSKTLARPLTGDARAILERRLRDLDRLLMPMRGAEIQRASAAIAAMLGGFLSARSGDTKSVLTAYTAALNDLPLWAIEEACRKITRGALPDINPDFAPSAARLHQAVGELLIGLQGERHSIKTILETKPKDEEATPADARDRIVAGFAKLQSELHGRSSGGSDADKRRKAEMHQRQIERNDADIIAEWRAVGLEPIMSQGRPISLDLAKQIGAVRVERQQDVA